MTIETIPAASTVSPSHAADTEPALLVAAPEAAQLCGVSEATWWRHHSARRIPAPIKLGGRTLWRRRQLELWVELGCPDRATFEAVARARDGGKRAR